jgi:hypothetical protein
MEQGRVENCMPIAEGNSINTTNTINTYAGFEGSRFGGKRNVGFKVKSGILKVLSGAAAPNKTVRRFYLGLTYLWTYDACSLPKHIR